MTFGSVEHLMLLSQVMRWTNEARRSHLDDALFDPGIADAFTATDLVEKYASANPKDDGPKPKPMGQYHPSERDR